MKEWEFYKDVKVMAESGEDNLILAYRPLGQTRAKERVPVIIRETNDGGLQISRARVVAGQRLMESVSVTVQGVSAAQVALADLYQSVAHLRGGYNNQPVDLTPRGLAEAAQYFEARAEGQLDSFGRPRNPSHVRSLLPEWIPR